MIRRDLAWGLGGFTIVLASALLGVVLAPKSILAAGVNRVIPVPDLSAARYERAFALARYAPGPVRRQALLDAEAAASDEIRADPLGPEGWIRLAAARAVADNGPSRRALAALAQSYRVAACDRQAGPSRIRLALESWPQLAESDRRRALTELKTLYASAGAEGSRAGQLRDGLSDAVTGAREPSGRAAGEAALAAVGWSPAPAG